MSEPLDPRPGSISVTELKQLQSEKERVWITAWGNAYDVTDFLAQHPGGYRNLFYAAGLDLTQFLESTHPEYIQALLQKTYCLGKVDDVKAQSTQSATPHIFEVSPSHLYPLLKNDVTQHLRSIGLKNNGACTWRTLIKLLVLNTVLIVFRTWHIYLMPGGLQGTPIDVLVSMLNGVLLAIYFVHSYHDHSHGVITRSFGKRVANFSKFLSHHITGLSGFIYHYQHVLGHHQFTNHPLYDPDVQTTGNTLSDPLKPKSDVRFLHETQNASWFHRYQHVYVWFLYSLVLFKWPIQDLQTTLTRRLKSTVIQVPLAEDRFYTWSSKLFFLSYSLLLPLWLVSPNVTSVVRILSIHVLTMMSWGLYLVTLVQMSHLFSGSQWIHPHQGRKKEWMLEAIENTLDYNYTSPTVTFLTGGLNYQLIHHLFPTIAHEHLPKIAPYVLKTLKQKYKVEATFHYSPTFRSALLRHWEFLRTMAKFSRKQTYT